MIPRLSITLGDPAGVGPEVVVKALARADVRAACAPVVVGDHATLRETAARLGERLDVEVVDETPLAPSARRPGRPTIAGGRASYRWIETATRLRDDILAAGGSRDPGDAYRAFRGRLPTADALLRKRGFAEAAAG